MVSIKLSHVTAGFIAMLVGYTSSVAVIFAALEQLQANDAQAKSWMLVLGLGMGLSTLFLTFREKMPVLTAWSTPGAALIGVSSGVTLSEAIGAFIFCAILLIATGLTRSFERLAKFIPASLANAMLAGILFSFGMKIFDGLNDNAPLVALMGTVYLILKRYAPRYAIAAVLAIGLAWVAVTGGFDGVRLPLAFAAPVFVAPEASWTALIGLGLPLYLVTMSSQNLAGIVTLRSNGYEPDFSAAVTVTGLFSLVLAPLGGFAFNLAAITAAICAGPEADEAPETRYKAALFAGLFYVLVGLMGATVIGLFLVLPKTLVVTIAALALLGTIGNSLSAALGTADEREAALVTLMVTVSSFSLLGIGAPLWALLLGLIVRLVLRKAA